MEAIGSFLQGFSGNFKAALLLWPLLSAALTLPLAAYLYHRDGRLRASAVLAAYAAVLYIAGLGCFTLYPLPSGTEGPGITYGIPPQLDPLNFIYDIRRDGLKAVLQLVFNVVLFVPLGFIAKRFLRLGLPAAALLSLATTLLIETAQLTGLFGLYPFAYRTFEVDDIVNNTLGGILGWFAGCLLDRAGFTQKADTVTLCRQPGFIRRCVALWIDCLLMGAGSLVLWSATSLMAELAFKRILPFFGLDGAGAMPMLAIPSAAALFAIVEGVVPWTHGGSTPGGLFTHMTFETKQRNGGWRLFFYGLRMVVLALALLYPPYAFPLLGVFYLIARQMPYDLLPSEPPAHRDPIGEPPVP